MVGAGTFSRLSRKAKAWLAEPNAARLTAVREAAEVATKLVPDGRRADWEKLLAGFVRREPAERRRARVEGLVRACALFGETNGSRQQAAPKPKQAPPPRLRAEDDVDALRGVGRSTREALAAHGVRTLADLVWTLPVGWDDFGAPVTLARAAELARASPDGRSPRLVMRAVVKSAGISFVRGRRSVRVVLEDGGKTVHAWWFFAAHGVLSIAKPGVACLIAGRLMGRDGRAPILAHPDVVLDEPAARVVRPRYPRLGVGGGHVRRAVASALDGLDRLPDPVPAAIAGREGMPAIESVLRAVHGGSPDAERAQSLLERMAWAEAFTRVWERLLAESQQGSAPAPVLPRDRSSHARFRAELGFALTGAQARAMEEIARDLTRPTPMRRLLLGDVGSGKTAVALAAAAQCVAAGKQVAILVPTSLLAEQYLDAAAPLARATGASVALFTAGQPAAQRRRSAELAARGEVAVAVGTHALLRESLALPRLGLVVVDEQHRLGVAQRLALVKKGAGETRPHLLTLSATPIPRTLALALRGELATSTLDERPAGRPPVVTELLPRTRFESALELARAACGRGERVFLVTPTIDDDDDGAVARAEELARRLEPFRVLLVHGALGDEAKRRAMRAFRSGEGQVLVGTSVVEVGVDVPEATLIVVDEAERFGLAQLHQMRGRVGRGERDSRCVLLHGEPLSDLARRRLRALVETRDGAALARADLALRGAGDLGGLRQSGAEAELLYLDSASQYPWLERVAADARSVFVADPELSRPDHHGLALAVRRFAAAIAVREEAG